MQGQSKIIWLFIIINNEVLSTVDWDHLVADVLKWKVSLSVVNDEVKCWFDLQNKKF